MRKLSAIALSAILLLVGLAAPVASKTVVDCDAGDDLQAAIDGAPRGGVVTVRGTCVGNFAIDRDLSVVGRGGATLDGSGLAPVITIPPAVPHPWTPGATVILRGLTVRNGGLVVGSTSAGGILNNGTLTLVDSTVRDNVGNGIWNNWRLSVSHATVIGNERSGIANHGGTAHVSHTRIAQNGSGTFHGGGVWSGIYPWQGQVLVVEYSTIVDNHVQRNGGGVWCTDSCTLRHTRILRNSTGYSGGGLWTTLSSSLVLEKTQIRHNTPNDCVGC
jgi:hypothetical protein